ncbi:DUF3943 domain-containing protein, partial [candidate division KSB1 bacterium]
MKRTSHIFAVILLTCVGAARPAGEEIMPPKRADIAAAEILFINASVWAFAYYGLDGYWSQISWQSVGMNMRHGFEWDPNKFKTNFFDHPYHGNLYFNTARTNGLSFWEAAPFSFGGSMMWELFMESEFPSYNDLLMTTLGGIALGEVMFRFSEQILDDRAAGSNRVLREIGAAVVNPVGGFNRLIRGDMLQHRAVTNHIRENISGLAAIGGSGNWRGADIEATQVRPALSLTLQYGRPLEMQAERKPFDHFTFRLWTSEGDTARNMGIMARGLLAGVDLPSQNERMNHLVGLMQHYDYINNAIVNFGAVTLAGAWLSRFELGKGYRLAAAPHVGFILMGGSNNEYATSSHGLNYNYSTGLKARIDLLLTHPTYGALYADYNAFHFNSVQGIAGTDRVDVASVVYNIPIWKNVGLGAEYIHYFRRARYETFAGTEKNYNGLRMLLSYT